MLQAFPHQPAVSWQRALGAHSPGFPQLPAERRAAVLTSGKLSWGQGAANLGVGCVSGGSSTSSLAQRTRESRNSGVFSTPRTWDEDFQGPGV